MWFSDGVWRTITGFLFPIWGRNPWLKKYNMVVDSLPNVKKGQQPSALLISHPAIGNYHFTIQLNYLNWGSSRRRRWIKIYTLEI